MYFVGTHHNIFSQQTMPVHTKTFFSLADLRHHVIEFDRKQRLVPSVKEIACLRQKLERLKRTSTFLSIHRQRELEQKIIQLGKPPIRIPIEQLCQCLVDPSNDLTQKQIIYNKIFNKSTSPSVLTKGCNKCNVDFILDYTASTMTCPTCGEMQQMLRRFIPNSLGEEIEKTQEYNRVPLFAKFLNQYVHHDIEIPDDVLECILRAMFTSHSFHREKCRPSQIVAILRASSLHKYVPYAVMITRILNREDGATFLTRDEVNMLIERFKELLGVFSGTKGCKFLNYDFISHQMLLMEGKTEKAKLFTCHKTNDVRARSIARLKNMCEELNKSPRMFRWFVPQYHYGC